MSRRLLLVAGVGVALVIAGVVLVTTGSPTTEFGWTSYAPLRSGAYESELLLTFPDGSRLWSPQQELGAGIATLGLLVLVGLGGWVLGRRSRAGSG